jgi:thiosulfate/3-mercaptopyruvate sulfurtransferase
MRGLWTVVMMMVAAGVACCSAQEPVVQAEADAAGAAPTPDAADAAEPLTFFVYAAQLPALQRAGAVVMDARGVTGYRGGHIPGAVQAPWTDFVDGLLSGKLTDDLQDLQARLRAMGVRADRPVIVYADWDQGWGEEGRAFWMLEYLGHQDVHVLYGGLHAWEASGGDTDILAPNPAPGDFIIETREALRASAEDVLAAIERGDAVILDTRERAEYLGATPYGEARGGHIPQAKHFAWKSVFDDKGDLRAPDALRAELGALGVGPETVVISYCTGGVRSGFMYMIQRWLGFQSPRNYDGSWWEWAGRDELPIVQKR